MKTRTKIKIELANLKKGDKFYYNRNIYEYLLRYTNHGITYDRTIDERGNFYDFCGDELIELIKDQDIVER